MFTDNITSRRTFLKNASLVFLGATLAFPTALSIPAYAAESQDGGQGKSLIVYYSRSGNTRKLAEMIRDRVNGDIVELKVKNPYPEKYERLSPYQ